MEVRPHGASFPCLKELVLGAVALEDCDLEFLLSASPVLEILTFIGTVKRLRARLASPSLRCAQFCLCSVDEVAVVDAPCLERLFIFWCPSSSVRVKIGHAPQLRMLGYLEPGVHLLEIGNTVIKSTTKPSPKTTVPSVQMLALHLQFRIHDEVKMLPSFLRCFPNVETLCIQGTEHAARRAAAFVRGDDVVHKLFTELAYGYRNRAGGYTRMLRSKIRTGDAATMAYIEFVDRENELQEPKPATPLPPQRVPLDPWTKSRASQQWAGPKITKTKESDGY